MYTAVSILVATSRPVSILTFHRDCFLVRPVVESSSGHEVKSRIKILAEDCQPIMITSMGEGGVGNRANSSTRYRHRFHRALKSVEKERKGFADGHSFCFR